MGNSSSSTSSRVRHKSESMEIRQKKDRPGGEFSAKSRSLMELGSSQRIKRSIVTIKPSERPRQPLREHRSGGTVNGLSRSKSLRKDPSHPISSQGREIILQCFENPHSEFGNKVLQRIFEKRNDYQKYVYTLGKERAYQMSIRLKELVEEVVAKIFDPDHICSISRTYGEEHVELKAYGFKPDFWVTIADAITVEGVILDMANHQPADTVAAWSSLVTMMFSAVRDGYYSALRRHRLSSRRSMQRPPVHDGNADADSNVEATTSSTEKIRPRHPAVRSASMYAVTSSNVADRRTNGSMNVMAPVVTPRRVTPVISRQLSVDQIKPITRPTTAGPRSLTSPIHRSRPIFE
ncbi:hypothetical protein GCK32_000062 [Trichostrongylus colubriformis]|uniref:Uncharacterized protein n=1 Tax=Trichostrongylus colubriformis TaxID=6319 RepID=A0AAN8FJ79_TRICO